MTKFITTVEFKTNFDFPFEMIFALYKDANWSYYIADKNKLEQAIENSLFIITAWIDNKLVGILRAVGDDLTILYIQDIIVLQSYRRQGIGRLLLEKTIEKYSNVRQIVLMTDETRDMISFYENCGMIKTQNLKLQTFAIIRNQ